jgi:hypothetical protein
VADHAAPEQYHPAAAAVEKQPPEAYTTITKATAEPARFLRRRYVERRTNGRRDAKTVPVPPGPGGNGVRSAGLFFNGGPEAA